MSNDDVFTAMIKEEINQYQLHFLFNNKEWLKEENYMMLAYKGLRQTKLLGIFVLFSILIFSVVSVYHFVRFGHTANAVSLWLGIGSWAFVIISTVYYTRDVLEKKKSMRRILKLLEARKEYYKDKETVHR